MNVLLTGAQGRLGSALGPVLVKAGHRLWQADSKSGQDLRRPELCDSLVARVDAVVHLASLGVDHPRVAENDLEIATHLVEAARRAGLKRFLFFSSINVFGQGQWKISRDVVEPASLPIDATTPCFPEDPYGRTKLAIEKMLSQAEFPSYCLRLPGVWRSDQTRKFRPYPCPQLTALNVIDPWIYLDIRDLARAVLLYLGSKEPPLHGLSYLTASDTTRPESTPALLQRYLPHWEDKWRQPPGTFSPWFSSHEFAAEFGWQAHHSWRRWWKRWLR